MISGRGLIGWRAVCVAAMVWCVAAASPAGAVLVFNNGGGVVAFGVADYGGAPVNGPPTYIANNFNGNVDVLTSPGHGFLTADTSIVNNIAQFPNVPPGPIPGFAFQVGGGNANGSFGSAAAFINPAGIGFALTDNNPDAAGAASYMIASWTSTFTNAGALNGVNYGSFLGVTGRLNSPGAAVAVALRSRLTDTDGNWVNFDLPELVLAAAGNGNFQALGGPLGLNAGMALGGGGFFAGLAVNNLGPVNLTNGDVLTIESTLTVIGDPAEINVMFDIDPLLLEAAGTTLPDLTLIASTPLPAPGSGVGLVIMLGSLAMCRARRLA